MKLIVVFPGQGSQSVGMGRSLVEQFPLARRTFEEASDALGFDVFRLCSEGPSEQLTLTEFTQPCLLTTSVAAFRVAQEQVGIKPAATAGHSLGEYSALVAAEALPFAQAVRWVRARGQAMQKAVPSGRGGMTAVLGLTEPDCLELCQKATTPEHPVEPANYNAPGQIVVSGSLQGLAQLPTLAPQAKFIPLAVSAPFHCRLMAPARETMSDVFREESAPVGSLRFPYVSNVDAQLESRSDRILEKLLLQLDHAVRWQQSVELLLTDEPTVFLECGPGAVLQGLGKRIAKAEGARRTVEARWTGISDTDSLKAFEKEFLGRGAS